ncbi:DUF2835 domain-containing protein [Shewanella sp. 202IG2-18]|uniref:DUF2835 domain-containing protein n=1 Tax=Parashewanella hymeniacidonis TaxID=2807618 RepID=UPI0019615A7B|nr:DUF2835 domain-containing protein [Parashewanella hymeniacidonis]MBM7071920.1 DUF2835 domain-containing protein [Parashewanella hymeniacidonis]
MEFYFRLSVSYDNFLPYYQGVAKRVEVREHYGRILHINAYHFKPFLTPQGIEGNFKIQIDDNGTLRKIEKL